MKKTNFFTISYLIALFLLLLNDLVLKYKFPGFISGKLSDFAGLFIFPAFFAFILPKQKSKIYFLTATLFVLWKSPASQQLIDFWNAIFPYQIARVIDYTDLIALLILPLSFKYGIKSISIFDNRLFKGFVFGLSMFAIIATAGTHGHIRFYDYGNSKENISQAMQEFYKKYPNYTIPDSLGEYAWYTKKELEQYRLQFEIPLERFTFDYYLEIAKKRIVITAMFEMDEHSWQREKCTLSLIRYIKVGERGYYERDLSWGDIRRVEKIFEQEILTKLTQILKEKYPDDKNKYLYKKRIELRNIMAFLRKSEE